MGGWLEEEVSSVCCESSCTMFALSWQDYGTKYPYGKTAALHPGIGKTQRGPLRADLNFAPSG